MDEGVRFVVLALGWLNPTKYSPHYFKSCKISAVALIKMVRIHRVS